MEEPERPTKEKVVQMSAAHSSKGRVKAEPSFSLKCLFFPCFGVPVILVFAFNSLFHLKLSPSPFMLKP